MRYRKKPVEVEAMRYDGRNALDITLWMGGGELTQDFLGNSIEIPTLEGVMRASIGDWIIRGVKGEFYPVKPDIFDATYEEVVDAAR